MAWDEVRGEVVLFGGWNGAAGADTWVWDGTDWTQRSPATSPPGRSGHAMAYDTARGETVLFGGGTPARAADTWVWDGSDWAQQTTSAAPSPRYYHAMADDTVRGEVVLFGGDPGGGAVNDTWVWDGAGWSQESPATSPPVRCCHALAPAAGGGVTDVVEVALFGGWPNGADTWVWDGDQWVQSIVPGPGPSARSFPALAYDSQHEKTVLFGGSNGPSDDTWTYDMVHVAAPGPGDVSTTTTSITAPPITVPPTTTSVPLPVPNTRPGPPTLAAPADGAELPPDEAQRFAIRVSDPDGDVWTGEVTVTNTGTGDTTTFETTPAPSGEDSTGAPVPPLEPGDYTWSATATDARGLESDPSVTRAFTVLGNRAPSVPVLVAPDPDHRFSLTDPQVFTVSSTDPDDDPYSALVTVRDAGTEVAVREFPTTTVASGEDATGTPPPLPLSPGDYTWTAIAKDAGGHASEESAPRAFTVGNASPVVPTLLSPEPTGTFSTTGPQTFTVAATDPDGDPYSATVTVRDLDDGTVVTTFSAPPSPSGGESVATPESPLPAGNYTWTAVAEDAHGAEGDESEPRVFSVSVNRPPEIPALVSPGNGEEVYLEDSPVFTIQAVDPEGAPYTGTVTVTGPVSTSFTTTAVPSGSQSSGSPETLLPAGNYTWTATATDAFGVTGPPSVSRSFTVKGSIARPSPVPPAPGPITRASVSSTGEQASGDGTYQGEPGYNGSFDASLSADGRFVAFRSFATNLVPQDNNTTEDVFVRDRVTGVTERVSVPSLANRLTLGGHGNQESDEPAISPDGRYVAFTSAATNLVPGDTNGVPDIFVHDRTLKVTTRVSVASTGAPSPQANDWSSQPSISADGRFVAFSSRASNLVGGDTNLGWDVFVRDTTAGTTERVSVSSSGAQGNQFFSGADPSISEDGLSVAFNSEASNLVPGDTNGAEDVFVRDRTWGVTVRVSVSSSEAQGSHWSQRPAISGSGRYVAFSSGSVNLVPGDTNLIEDVFVRDIFAGTTERVSLSSTGAQANGRSGWQPAVSSDGRYVAFRSSASNLVPGDRNGRDDVFLRDRTKGATTLLTHGPDGLLGSGDWGTPDPPSVSVDGYHVAFDSHAPDLVPGDTNEQWDAFAYNRRLSLQCAGGSLSAVGCLSGYGFQAASSKIGLEDFYPYHPFDLGSDTAFLNAATGNLVVQATDLEVPGPGLNLRLTRTYNAQADQGIGPLGRGWRLGIADGEGDDVLGSVVSALLSADVGQLLEVVATEDQFDFYDADGTRHHFVKGGLAGPGWHAPPGVNLTLTDHLVGAERRYRATRPDGVVYEFAPVVGSYGLTSIADRNGNTLTFAYASGALSSITDTTGRTISFTWSGGYLASATYSGSGGTATVTYTVNATTGRLTSVAAGGRTVSYTYVSSRDPIATATDGRGNTTTFAFNESNMLTSLTDRAGKAWDVTYNTTGCQPGTEEAAVATCVTDPEGHTTTYASSAEGNLLHVRDAGDTAVNQRNYLWEGNRLVWEGDEAGDTTEYAYNGNGQVVFTRESGGNDASFTSVFTYRDVSPGVADLVSARAGVGSGDERVWRFGLDEAGNLLSTTDPGGAVTGFGYYTRGLLKTVKDPRGSTTTYGDTAAPDGGYHASGQPPSVTDPLGHAKTFTYDAFGRPTSIVDRNANTWSFAYDARGNLTSQTAPGPATTTYAYDANDNPTSMTPPGGATVTKTYDARDLLTSSQATVGGTLRKTTNHYADDGMLIEIREPRTYAGSPTVTQTVSYQHFPNNRVRAMVDEEGNQTDVTYTPDGLLRTVLEPPGAAGRHATTHAYNRRGQVTSVLESGHSKPTTHTYNVHGERLASTTPGGATTHFEYDKVGRPTRTTNPDGTASTRVYDRAGNLVRVTQPAGKGKRLTTSYSYTSRGEIASESDPEDGVHTITYEYDPEGRQRYRKDRRYDGIFEGTIERAIEQTFRADGAVLSRTATGTGRPTHASTFTYDAAGNLTTANASLDGDAVSAVSVSYNGAFEPVSVSETVFGITKITSYTYQPDGLLASRTSDGNATTYTHAKNGVALTVVPWGAMGSFTNTYFSNGALNRATLPNGAVTEHLYDPADRLTSRIVRRPGTTGDVLSSWTAIAYDDDDRRTSEAVVQAQPADAAVPVKSGNASYTYDALGRLTSAKHPFDGKPATYTLDDAGNVVRESGASSAADYRYRSNRLRSKSFSSSETTAEGDATTTRNSSGRSAYTHDRLGNLTRAQTDMTSVVTTETAGQTLVVEIPASNITTTTYNAASHTRRVSESDGSYVDYAYDALGRLARRIEHPASGADTTTLFFHDGTSQQVTVETDAGGVVETRYVLDSSGVPLGQHDDNGRAYFVVDPRGNTTQLLAHDQSVKAVYAYDPFGKDRPAHTNKVGSWDSRLRFQTAPQDPKTGAYALGPRLYDPAINRFVGADHYVGAAANMALATDPLTGNRYLYAGANPAGLIDDGHSPGYYSSSWHPTSWNVTAHYYWQAKWNFYTWGTWTPTNGFTTHHEINASMKGRFVTHIKVEDWEQGACEQCWNDLNASIEEAQREAYGDAVQQAIAAVRADFARYLKSESWLWDVSFNDVMDVLSTVGGYFKSCVEVGAVGSQALPFTVMKVAKQVGTKGLGPAGAVLGCAGGGAAEWLTNKFTS